MYYAKKGKKSYLVMKLKLSKKLLLLATTSTLALTGCGLDSELENTSSVEFEEINKEPEVLYSESDEVVQQTTDLQVVEEPSIIVSDGQFVKANETVNIREYANTESEKLGLLGIGASAKCLGEENGFYKIDRLGIIGYVSKDYTYVYNREHVNVEPIKNVYFPEDTLAYNEYMENIAVIPKNESAFVYDDLGDTYLVEADGLVCYVDKSCTYDLTGRYAVIDKSDQRAYVYDDTTSIFEAPTVTGKPSSPTPEGYFKINSKRYNYCLGGDPRHFTDVMLKFKGNCGFHCAEESVNEKGKQHGWRPASHFGTDIYLTNGSAGCCNLRHEDALEIDKLLEVGTPVLVKK